MSKGQDLIITDPNEHFSNISFNTEVAHNLQQFMKTLTKIRVILSHFLRHCFSHG